jgi:hypothetical protein
MMIKIGDGQRILAYRYCDLHVQACWVIYKWEIKKTTL